MKLPRDLCANDVLRALRRKGFSVEHQRGSHIRMSNGPLRVTIPNHSALEVKTLQSILGARTRSGAATDAAMWASRLVRDPEPDKIFRAVTRSAGYPD